MTHLFSRYYPEHMFPDEEPTGDAPFDEAKVHALSSALDDELRKVGIFVDQIAVIQHPARNEPMLAVAATIGDIAFSDRIQRPEEHEIRSNLREVERDIKTSDFTEARDSIMRDGFFGRDEEEGGE